MRSPKSPPLARCTRPGISVQFAEGGRNFSEGELVDLDADARPGLTWREVLGPHVEAFESVTVATPAEE